MENTATRAEPVSKKEKQSAAARERILAAVIECLDRYGYSETSINRIQGRSGMSRGALTHHFPSKEELMAVTAEHLLRPTLIPPRHTTAGNGRTGTSEIDVEADIIWIWERLVDTREGRALLEILVASRTDEALRQRIAGTFARWNKAINDSLVLSYGDLGMNEEELAETWMICRVFLRGLNTQSQFDEDPALRRALVRRFAKGMASQFQKST